MVEFTSPRIKPKRKNAVVVGVASTKYKWVGDSLNVLNGDVYYGGVSRMTGRDKEHFGQYDVVQLRHPTDGSTMKLATVHALWADAKGKMMMEVRYMKPLSALPISMRKKLAQSTTASTTKEEVVDTTEIDEVPVANVVKVVNIAASYICTKLYAPLTGTLTVIAPDSRGPDLAYVYSRRLKWIDSGECVNRKRRRVVDGATVENDGAAPLAECQSRLEAACDQLQLSSIPDTLLGREDERRQIYHTLKLAIVDGESSPVYISGLPGMGKTATVKEILRTLERERAIQAIPAFTWIEINGLHMPKPDQAYSMIWKTLESFHFHAKTLNSKRARDCLDAFFKDNTPRPALVLVLDEMDFMLAGKNTVLYNFLEWQALPSSKLVVVGIANIMDLPERLAPKLRSRFGVNRIAFRSYTHDQIERILHQRLATLHVFEAGSIEIYAKALAHQSGDIRKALMVCKAAVERTLRRVVETQTPSKVLSTDIEAAQAAMSESPLVMRLRQCSTFECIFLVALLREVKLQPPEKHCGKRGGDLEGVATRVINLTKTAGLARIPSFAEIQAVCFELERCDIVREKKGQWELTFSHDEIQDAFIAHPVGRLLWT
ncbi:hypothetical protein H310_07995 [Aphanomyces invadans]|uniref:Origin recognition complex subunit 1 n=1 Tax=Aphanomyces invadans TaxID=157072 RepID=A0A024TYK2_9STRA|nr:hypothetical protein H310_07995 [Aphanomyces invadans]ETV99245.1 hypothetical protein H310_07995 [Aphanomyces invadans]|eukprot:XP_008871801.1 hypothetical protein H310_07995 [Aphanomyces invadans]